MKKVINNIHIYPSTFINESRIFKETESLIRLGLVNHILMVGVWKQGLEKYQMLDDHRAILRIKERLVFKHSLLNFIAKYFIFQFQVIWALRKVKIDVVNCHNLSVLGIGVFFKIFKGSQLIYDAHELETEVEGAKGVKKHIGKSLEAFYMPFIDEIFVVSNLIGEWYKKRYKFPFVTVIKNVPYFYEFSEKPNKLREMFKIGEDKLVFIYQGVLSKGRGVNIIIDAFLDLKLEHHIVFMGMGELADEIKSISENKSNFHFIPAVPPSEIKNYTASADVGIHLIQNTCLNHYYCSPNKVYEYLMYGIPQIISDFPEMRNTIENGACGWLISPEKSELIKVLEKITLTDVAIKKLSVMQKRKSIGWQNEEMNLKFIYNKIMLRVK